MSKHDFYFFLFLWRDFHIKVSRERVKTSGRYGSSLGSESVRDGIKVPSAPSAPQLLSHSGWDLPARFSPSGNSLRELLRVLPFFLRGLACLRLLQRGPSAMISGFIDQSVRCSSARPADRSHRQINPAAPRDTHNFTTTPSRSEHLPLLLLHLLLLLSNFFFYFVCLPGERAPSASPSARSLRRRETDRGGDARAHTHTH